MAYAFSSPFQEVSSATFPLRNLKPGEYFIVPAEEVRRRKGQGQSNVSRAVKRLRESDRKHNVTRCVHFGTLPDGNVLVIRVPDEFAFMTEIRLPPPAYPKPRNVHLSCWVNERILTAYGKQQVPHYA